MNYAVNYAVGITIIAGLSLAANFLSINENSENFDFKREHISIPSDVFSKCTKEKTLPALSKILSNSVNKKSEMTLTETPYIRDIPAGGTIEVGVRDGECTFNLKETKGSYPRFSTLE